MDDSINLKTFMRIFKNKWFSRCLQTEHMSFFVYGFAKSAKANITPDEKKIFKKLAKLLLAITPDKLEAML